MENKNTYLSEKSKAISMFGWTNKRYKGISIAYIAMLLITFPLIEIIFLLQNQEGKGIEDYVELMMEAAPDISGSIFAFVAILFSTIFAIVAFSYMHNKRCMDLFGSLPIRRRALFFTRYISVLVQTLIPMVVVGLVGAALSFKMSTFLDVMQNVAYLGLGVIGNVSFIALLSLCCGTVVDTIVSFFVINGIYPVCVAICSFFPKSMLPGYGIGNSDINWSLYTLFSPVIAPFAGIWGYDKSLYIIWWILFSAVLIAGCYIFSKKRKTEAAQNDFVFVVVEQIIKLFAGFVVSFGIGWIFAVIGANSNSSYKMQYVWLFVGICIGAFMTGIILHLIYHRGMSKIKISLIVSAIDVIVAFSFVMIVATGAFGYDERIPNVDEIQAVCVNVDDDDSYIVKGENLKTNFTEDKEIIKTAVEVHKEIVEDKIKEKKGVYPVYQFYNETESYEGEAYVVSQISMCYKLKNGEIIKRVYDGYFTGEKVEQLGTYSEKHRNAKKMMQTIPNDELLSVWLYDSNKNYTVDLIESGYSESSMSVKNKIIRLKKAIIEDYSTINVDDLKQENALYTIEFSYSNERAQYLEFNCIITDECKNTLKVLSDSYKNTDLMYLEQNYYSYADSLHFTGKDEKTVYFMVPDDWDEKAEIRAALYDSEDMSSMTDDFDADVTKCEKVRDNVWKYTYSQLESEDEEEFSGFSKIMFYQILEDRVNMTGEVKLPKDSDKQYLVLTKKKTTKDYDSRYARYKYHWE